MTRGKPVWPDTKIRTVGPNTVISITEPTQLALVIGWLKFTADAGEVLFRGQSSMHNDMLATGVRGKSEKGLSTLNSDLRSYIDGLYGAPCSCNVGAARFSQAHECIERSSGGTGGSPIASGTYRAVTEPLLQHYGLNTRWVDVVDNVWIALWFACHRQVNRDSYAYHLRRSVGQEGADAVAYIAAADTGLLDATRVPGYRISNSVRVVDLRYSVPSYYLRPHAQHGLLMAPRTVTPAVASYSLKSAFTHYIEIKLADALDWLGTGVMTSTYSLFPSPIHDEGYRRLLEYALEPPTSVGQYTKYGPGL